VIEIEEIECPAGAVGAAEALVGEEYVCFLDSSLPGEAGRWSFLAFRPLFVMTAENGRVLVGGRGAGSDPFSVLAALLEQYRIPAGVAGPPFACGAAGYLSYDLARYLEALPSAAAADLPQPDLCLAFYDCTVAFDNADGRAWLCHLPSARGKARDARLRLRSVRQAPLPDCPPAEAHASPADLPGIECNFTRSGYLRAVELVQDYIAAGDVYQINLSQRFSVPFPGNPWALYKLLRTVNPSPFGCFLDFPGLTLASASPERFLKLDGATRVVETRPIKGTRPRGRTRAQDRELAAELEASEKDRAENLMIVDMERNDLGRVCAYGSISVPSLWAIREHPNVFQMESIVRGVLAPGKGPADLIAACFPGGSITGAPKIRAVQIIEELEPTRRGIYTGSVGYIDLRGNLDCSIVIRSIVLRNGRAYFHGGGGIVADSVPENEYQETLDKVSGLAAALKAAPG